MEKAQQTCELWKEAYPRSEMPLTMLSGIILPVLGQYEKAVEEGTKAVQLNPNFPISYTVVAASYVALNRPDDATGVHREALAHKLDFPDLHIVLYQIGFLQNDVSAMNQQVEWSVAKPGTEDEILALEADTAAYSGHLRKAREFSRLAMDSAGRAGEKEVAALYSAQSGLREALFGNAEEARQDAILVIGHSAPRDLQYGAALALAYAGDDKRAQTLTDSLSKRFPEDTIVQFNYLPTLRAKSTLSRGNGSEAVDDLRASTPYELGMTTSTPYGWDAMYPVFVRGEAYLAAHQGNEAAAEFQKILDHRGVVVNEPIGALAQLQIGKAYAMQGDTAKAKAAYTDFLTLWKDADSDIPVLKQAKAEYARLQ